MLIRDIETARRFVASLDFSDLERLEPFLIDIEAQFLKPTLGTALYALLDVEDQSQLSGPLAELLPAVQRPLAQLAVAAGLPELQTTISATGVQIQSTQTHKTAFQWQVDAQRAELRRKGHNALGDLIEALETSAEPFAAAWRASDAGKAHRRVLITGLEDFTRYYVLPGGREVLLQLLPDIRRAEDFDLVLATGLPLLQELRTQTLDRNLSIDNAKLLADYIWPALAHLSVATALCRKESANLIGTADPAQNAEQALLSSTVGTRYLQLLRRFLNESASAERFATYFNSTAYVAPAPAAPRPPGATARFC